MKRGENKNEFLGYILDYEYSRLTKINSLIGSFKLVACKWKK
jgi:hypothetical protein